MRAKFQKIALAAVALASGWVCQALDLPVKRVSGIDYYYYTVERNENLGDVSHKLGVSRQDIVTNNPTASDGLSRGTVLYFPVHLFPEDNLNLPGQSSANAGVDAPTRYKVQKGETLYGIAHRFDVHPDEILALNPQVSSGVKHGQMLMIPHVGAVVDTDHSAATPPTVPRVIPPKPEESEPADDDDYAKAPPLPDTTLLKLHPVPGGPVLIPADSVPAEDEVISPIEAADSAIISIMLPLMLDQKGEENKSAKNAADFVRGFMLGVKTVSDSSYPCILNVFDTEGNADKIQSILSNPLVESSDIIISHEEGPAGQFIPEFAYANENYVLNLFASHDTTYLVNPYILQANVPANIMYEKAGQALLAAFPDHKPVILIAKGGRGEKMPFVEHVTSLYAEKGITPINLSYEGMLTSNEVEGLDPTGKYVFIPVSGALSEFNKFATTLAAIRENAEDPSSIALFGYPDWTTFRGEALENLHHLNAVIYSRFFSDDTDPRTKRFIKQFEDAYGIRPLEQVPSQAMLGYDSARYLLGNMAKNSGFFTPAEPTAFRGVQSTFMFEHPDEGAGDEAGYVNTALYIVTYTPGGHLIVQVL